MGKQFQIYLLPSDTERLVKTLHQKIPFRFLASRSVHAQPTEIDTPIRTEEGFTRADALLVPDLSVSIKLDNVERQGYWSICNLFSEVVEFSGCHFDGNTLKRGRFFYDTGFYAGQRWQEKSPRFLEWADELFRAAKKSLKRIPGLDAYVGSDAEQWHSDGGVFVHLVVKGQPPLIAK